MLIEVIVTNVTEAIQAEEYGADRLELIHSFSEGGLSPELMLTKEVCDAVSIPVNVMVRPHGRNFVYDHNDMKQIQQEIDYIITHTKACDIVYGSLDNHGWVNLVQLEQVLHQLQGSSVSMTFHRAIDVSNDVVESAKVLSNYTKNGLKRVLSSGGKDDALTGAANLRLMQDAVYGSGLIILAGSGITPENASWLIKESGVSEIHLGSGLRYNNQLQCNLFDKLIVLTGH